MFDGKKVLVIDDTKLVRKIITAILKMHKIEVLEAENGLEGLKVLEAEFENIRAVTVDIEMPVMDGFEFVKKVRENRKYQNLPIIFVTSLSEKENIERGLEFGVYDYIVKPVEKTMVYLKIKNAINFYENNIELEKVNMAKNIILYHHEKWNGNGYCNGLKGEEIPIEARIVAISDVFDALSTKRVYKEKFEIEKTLNIMLEGRGEHFDPNIFDLFLKNLDKALVLKEKYKDEE